MKPYIQPTAFVLMLFSSVSLFAQTPLHDGSTYSSGGSWSPYVAGGLIGILTWATFYFSEHPIGASSFYATVAGFIGKAVAPQRVKKFVKQIALDISRKPSGEVPGFLASSPLRSKHCARPLNLPFRRSRVCPRFEPGVRLFTAR